jgi:hypothetical protein
MFDNVKNHISSFKQPLIQKNVGWTYEAGSVFPEYVGIPDRDCNPVREIFQEEQDTSTPQD